MDTQILDVTPETFESEVLKSDLPVLVYYSAPWCAPCKQTLPRVEQLAAEYDSRVKVVKVDCEAHRDWAKGDNIRAVPTLRLYRDGQKTGEVTAAQVPLSLAKMFMSASVA